MNWYEAFEPGRSYELGSYRFEADDIVDFARQFDPQPFHLSEEAGAKSLFGGLAASGWQTASIFMKLYVGRLDRLAAEIRDAGGTPTQLGPSPGFENMRWLRPVLAGDTVTYRSTVLSRRPSASRTGWGIVTMHHEAENQHGDKVFEFTGNIFAPRQGGRED